MKKKPPKPWSGRFEQRIDPEVERFTASLHFDKRLYPFDIQGSIAHAKMLASVGLISEQESAELIRGLHAIKSELEEGKFPFDDSLEDIHMNIEARLIQMLGSGRNRTFG